MQELRIFLSITEFEQPETQSNQLIATNLPAHGFEMVFK